LMSCNEGHLQQIDLIVVVPVLKHYVWKAI
jgi:hypothetical protein